MFYLRPHSSLALVFALVCAMFAVPHAPAVQAQTTGKIFTVTTTGDNFSDPSAGCTETTDENNPPGCTLRQALNSANDEGNAGSTIDFNIPFSDPGYTDFGLSASTNAWIITPTLALPPITNDGTIIDGSTQTNRVGNVNNNGAEIIISGSNVTNAGGLQAFSNGNTIRGIGIINFVGDGSNTFRGVGIEITGDNNIIQGNYIGLGVAPNGTIAAPNRDAGIIIYGTGNTIGGNNTGVTTEFNVISGNNGDGILINGGKQNKIAGNFIGTNASGTAPIPNGGNGINIRLNGTGNIIGNYLRQTSASYRNFISGNGGYGIQITNSKDNKIYGNYIGLSLSGTGKIGNSLGGIRIDGTSTNAATGNEIGSITPAPQYMRNIIVGSSGVGIQLDSFGARLNRIMGNYIGIGANGVAPTGTSQLSAGIVLSRGASDNTIGGSSSTGETNIIAGISGDAIQVSGLSQGSSTITARNNIIQGNYIGVGISGSSAIPNSGNGILLNNYVSNTTIGGPATGQGNRIANNAGDGIHVTGAKPVSTLISNNTIRVNVGNGVTVNGTNVMTTTLSNNSINLNGGDGVQISGANNTLIFSNTIGMRPGDAVGNGVEGIRMTNSFSATVQANQVIGNQADGVRMSAVTSARLLGNTVNQNDGNGISVINDSTAISITSSTVYSNTEDGVFIGAQSLPAQHVKVTDNSISANGGLGINLEPQTDGLPGLASNPNHDIDAPFNVHINQDGLLTGRVYGTAGQPASCIGCTIQIFGTNPELRDGQGKTRIDAPVEISSNGYFTATIGSIPNQLALTATDQSGNTSEFGVFDATFGLVIGPPRTGTAAPGETITYTHRITNTGTVNFTDLQLSATSSKGWTTNIVPPSPISLAAGESKPVTLTLTLPKAPNSTVLAGTVDLTRVTLQSSRIVSATASVTDTTTVASAFKLEVSPPARSGSGVPEQRINYTHTLRNSGNLTGTVVLSASTDLQWTTSVTPTQVILGPGEQRDIVVSVTVPQGAMAGTVAKTTVDIQVISPIGQPSVVITDTTTVATQPLGTIIPDREASGAIGETIPFQHTVQNLSNGPVTFSLEASAPKGITVALRGSNLGANNTLQLAIGQSAVIYADVTLTSSAPVGGPYLIAINLLDDKGNIISGVQDTIVVTAAPPTEPPPGTQRPWAYLPLIQQYYDLGTTTPTP
ncbi:MAG TPA: right-handed parallel beta-helix repeat-containing protein [Roseiflexaceae bacterium]|nr:right-handed parallel beta-helix repeat-containing protein [Roseiflexaceae bacterium]